VELPAIRPTEDSRELYERYTRRGGRASRVLPMYYAVKPLIPRPVQLALRRKLIRRQAKTEFPAWPIEDALVRRSAQRLRDELGRRGSERLPFVNFWPERARFAIVLTHDVEGVEGLSRIEEVLEVERRYGFVSSWNFVAEWYPLHGDHLELVRRSGGEVGLHGIRHDGSLFRSRADFEEQLPKIHHYLDSWQAVGFRSPSTFRNADWMHELPCLYDSSFPQTDPFQPQPGGSCAVFPYFYGDVVELPMTLDQDHTLFELLQTDSIELWTRKATWLIEQHALVNVNVHPDYMTPGRLGLYEELLCFLREQQGGWNALPRDVALWWKARAATRCETAAGGTPRVEGPAEAATVAWARWEGGHAEYEV
jgi:hypothetical protein